MSHFCIYKIFNLWNLIKPSLVLQIKDHKCIMKLARLIRFIEIFRMLFGFKL